MNGQGKKNPTVPDALEFESVDLPDARKSLEELPPGVTERQLADPNFWLQHRRKPLPTDRALTGAAIDWLIGLPEAVRPKALCEHFPRIANRLAEIWRDQTQAARELGLLQEDGRPGRKGFAWAVQAEIQRLSEYIASTRSRNRKDAK